MSVQLSLNLDGTSDEGLILLSTNSAAAVTAHPEVFVTPKPPPAELAALTTGFQQAMVNQVNTQAAATEATRLKAVARGLLEDGLRARGLYVVELSVTVPSAPSLCNLPLRPPPRARGFGAGAAGPRGESG